MRAERNTWKETHRRQREDTQVPKDREKNSREGERENVQLHLMTGV